MSWPSLQAQPTGDVFAGTADQHYNVRGAVLSLRQDAANGTGAPQLALDPGYPSSLPAWQALRQRAPAATEPFERCAQLLIQATEEIKRVAPLMQGRITRLKTLNDGIGTAKALIKQGDDCIAKAGDNAPPRLQGGVTAQVPGRPPVQPPGGVLVPGRGTPDRTVPQPQPQTELQGGIRHEDQTQPELPVRGYRVPRGYVQPRAPNFVCFDIDGYPYTVLVDPGVEPPYNSAPGRGVVEPDRIPPVRGSYDECINPNKPKGCPPDDIRRAYRRIKETDACRPPPEQQREPEQATVPVFHYFYVNGINTPEHDGGRAPGQAINRGNYDWDRQLIAGNLLGTAAPMRIAGAGVPLDAAAVASLIRVAPDEQNRFDYRTYNYSGTQPHLDELCRLNADWLLLSLCTAVKDLNRQRASGFFGMAGGDIWECLLQAFGRNTSAPAADNRDVATWVEHIVQTYRNEGRGPQPRQRHYFILIGHSQGNFLVEGMVWRLQNLAGTAGKEIFNRRLAVLALASPTDYPSFQQGSAEGTVFAGKRLLHATRRDDAILALRAPGQALGNKVPFGANLPALWAWKKPPDIDALDELQRLVGRRPGPGGQPGPYYIPLGDAMSWTPEAPCKPDNNPLCNGALYTPLMNSHLIDNYLTSPTLTRPGQALNFKVLRYLDMGRMQTAPTPVLDAVRDKLRLLKAELIRP